MQLEINKALEESALRQSGLLGRGRGMGNALYSIDYDQLPIEARKTIDLIIKREPFPYAKDGTRFEDRFGDLLSRGEYLEFTVPTPGIRGRGARRIVARRNGMLFFTACHYERIQGRMSQQQRRQETAKLEPEWRNGFYVITGMSIDLRNRVLLAIKQMNSLKRC